MRKIRSFRELPRRTFWRETAGSLIFVEIDYGGGQGPSRRLERTEREEDGQFVGSLCASGMHAPALDIDLPVTLANVSSGRPTVTFRREVPKRACLRLLAALRDAGILAPSWARAAFGRWSVGKPAVMVPEFEVKAPVRLLASSTEGHFHLYFDTELTAAAHDELLDAFEEAGIIGADFRAMAKRNGTTLLIKPGLTKRDLRPVAPARQWESAY